jgi:hypothetical protein
MSDMLHHNNPPQGRPQAIVDSILVYKAAAQFLEDSPVIDSEELAQQATQWRSNLKSALKAMGDAKEAMCKPLWQSWQDGLAIWKKPISTVEKLEKEVSDRLAAYMRAEDAKRQAALAEARRLEREAEEAARKAEAAEKEAIDNAKVGECVDVAQVMLEADTKFAAFEDAAAAAAQAARDATVRTRGRFDDRATSLRTKETLIVTDMLAAIRTMMGDMDCNAALNDAVLTAARKFRSKTGALPEGVESKKEKVL